MIKGTHLTLVVPEGGAQNLVIFEPSVWTLSIYGKITFSTYLGAFPLKYCFSKRE